MSDEEAIRELSGLKGIGIWTAEMILLFCLQRPIFSAMTTWLSGAACEWYITTAAWIANALKDTGGGSAHIAV